MVQISIVQILMYASNAKHNKILRLGSIYVILPRHARARIQDRLFNTNTWAKWMFAFLRIIQNYNYVVWNCVSSRSLRLGCPPRIDVIAKQTRSLLFVLYFTSHGSFCFCSIGNSRTRNILRHLHTSAVNSVQCKLVLRVSEFRPRISYENMKHDCWLFLSKYRDCDKC